MIRKLSLYLCLLTIYIALILVACSGPSNSTSISSLPTATDHSSLHNVTFIAFHDYNGNGHPDAGDPYLAGITAQLAGRSCATGEDGICDIEGVADGQYESSIVDSREVMAYLKMRYILPSISEVKEISSGMDVFIDGEDAVINLPLGQGSCVEPFPAGWSFDIGTYFDIDARKGMIGNWKGEGDFPDTQPSVKLYSYRIRVQDDHFAIDYLFREQTPVLASDVGVISVIATDSSQKLDDDHIIIIKTDTELLLNYGHVKPLPSLYVGQRVERGQLIGYSIQQEYYPFFQSPVFLVHFGAYSIDSYASIDPYRSLWIAVESDQSRIELIQ